MNKACELLTNPSYLFNGAKQFVKTVQKPSLEDLYSEKEDLPKLCFLPGWTADLGTYKKLLKKLSPDFSILPLENFPEDLKAVFSRSGIAEQAQLLLQTLENAETDSVYLVGHSNGGLVGTYARNLIAQKNSRQKINQIVTLSSPLQGSKSISQIPIISHWARAVRDLDPESEIIKSIKAEGQIENAFVSLKDELFTPDEMRFDGAKEHEVDHGHFDYMLGKNSVVEDTARRIKKCLISES